ncbi:MAG: CoA transferase subunit A [Microbispora sp.]|nr:CoA transferase subunit A [Microbispora sp.]
MTAAIHRGRTPVVLDLETAIATIRPGAVVGIGGAVTAGHPMALVRALARSGVRDLTVVAPTAGLDVDVLVAAGCVRTVVSSYVGAEGAAPLGPAFRAAAEAGEIEVRDVDEAHCILGLRAAAQGLPFLPWLGGVGTALPELNPELVEFEDPISGRRLLAVPALRLDVALVFAEAADAYGNVQFVGTGHADPLMASAAKRVIVQVERVVENEEIRRSPGATRFWPDATVVRAPWGTHPYSSAVITADEEHLRGYARVAAKAARGERAELDAYLERYVAGPQSHEDYLEAIGIRRIAELLI